MALPSSYLGHGCDVGVQSAILCKWDNKNKLRDSEGIDFMILVNTVVPTWWTSFPISRLINSAQGKQTHRFLRQYLSDIIINKINL